MTIFYGSLVLVVAVLVTILTSLYDPNILLFTLLASDMMIITSTTNLDSICVQL